MWGWEPYCRFSPPPLCLSCILLLWPWLDSVAYPDSEIFALFYSYPCHSFPSSSPWFRSLTLSVASCSCFRSFLSLFLTSSLSLSPSTCCLHPLLVFRTFCYLHPLLFPCILSQFFAMWSLRFGPTVCCGGVVSLLEQFYLPPTVSGCVRSNEMTKLKTEPVKLRKYESQDSGIHSGSWEDILR